MRMTEIASYQHFLTYIYQAGMNTNFARSSQALVSIYELSELACLILVLTVCNTMQSYLPLKNLFEYRSSNYGFQLTGCDKTCIG